jgi:chorismate mutase
MSISSPPEASISDLGALRQRIDAIDEAMHRLLIERGDIIDALIHTKKSADMGSAFRPQREADMMRRLAARHTGSLPLEVVESLWRTIIGTFTWLQMPYCVHGDASLGRDIMRDIVRFHFGFTVPLDTHETPEDVIMAVSVSRGDLGVIRFQLENTAPWWLLLEGQETPKIIARLPFIERGADAKRPHPVGKPAFVISKPFDEGLATDSSLLSTQRERPFTQAELAHLQHSGFCVVSQTRMGERCYLLIDATRRDVSVDSPERYLDAYFKEIFVKPFRIEIVGTHAARFTV